eukprot:GHRQ01019083.1.p1 GENE.GHRQ01019083.1~~GHRQ01019083.1.p1  ORF type:complete len:107 (-),score=8.70 GHRQ01019083.1:530-850(-)
MLLAYSEAARGLCLSFLSMSGSGDSGHTDGTLAAGTDSARVCSSELRLTPAGLDGWATLERRAAAVALGSRGLSDVWGLMPTCSEHKKQQCTASVKKGGCETGLLT